MSNYLFPILLGLIALVFIILFIRSIRKQKPLKASIAELTDTVGILRTSRDTIRTERSAVIEERDIAQIERDTALKEKDSSNKLLKDSNDSIVKFKGILSKSMFHTGRKWQKHKEGESY